MGRLKRGSTYPPGQKTHSNRTDVQPDSPIQRLKKINEVGSKHISEILSGLISSLPPNSIILSGQSGHFYYFYDYLGMTAALIDSFRSRPLADTERASPEKEGGPADAFLQPLDRCLDGIATYLLEHGKKLAEKQVSASVEQADRDVEGWILAEILGTLTGKREKLLREYLSLSKAQTKARQGFRRPGGSKAKFDLSDLRRHYRALHPKCQAAKRLYRQNRKSPRWIQIVKAEVSDMDEDLILQLNYPDLARKCSQEIDDQGATSSAGDIALEWAARRCGVPPRQYKISYLKDRLSKLKQ